MSSRILLVEDNPGLVLTVSDLLSTDGHDVVTEQDGEAGLARGSSEDFDLIILDVMLPRKNGFDVCRELRQRGIDTGILMLTAKTQVVDRVVGLKLGADDYLAKPFELAEFEARIRALARRVGGVEAPLIRLGRLSFDTVSREARVDGAALDMPARERALLQLLVESAGSVVPKDRITARLSGFDDELTPNAVEIYVHRLRKRLEGSGCQLRTARGLGYVLDAG